MTLRLRPYCTLLVPVNRISDRQEFGIGTLGDLGCCFEVLACQNQGYGLLEQFNPSLVHMTPEMMPKMK